MRKVSFIHHYGRLFSTFFFYCPPDDGNPLNISMVKVHGFIFPELVRLKVSSWPDDQSSHSCSFLTLILILTSCHGEPLPASNLFWSFLLHQDQGLVVVGFFGLGPRLFSFTCHLHGSVLVPVVSILPLWFCWLTVVGFPLNKASLWSRYVWLSVKWSIRLFLLLLLFINS